MLKFSRLEEEKKEIGQYNMHKMCNKAVEEEPFSMQLLVDHLMLEFGHLFQDKKKETRQYKKQEMFNEDPSSLRHIPDKFKTQEICEKALEQDSWQLENVPDYFKTQDMCIEAVEDEPHPLLYVPDHFKTQGMCIEAVEKYPILLA